MCGGGAPAPVRSDPEADAERIAAEAAVAANADGAKRRRSRKQSALGLSQPEQTALGYGQKQTLGG